MLVLTVLSITLVHDTALANKANQGAGKEEASHSAPYKDVGFTGLTRPGTAQVRRVIDPLTLVLQDGRTVHLSGLDIPGQYDRPAGAIALKAKDLLAETTEGRRVRLYAGKQYGHDHKNRMGHYVRHVELADGNIWMQGLLLHKGLARVRTTPDTTHMARQMYNIEEIAREREAGLWDYDRYAPLTPVTAGKGTGHYAVIAGRIRSAAAVRNRIYLNFGQNWRTDFTISLPPYLRKSLSARGISPLSWNGAQVRVRGFVEDYNGPYIEIDHAERLEFLDGSVDNEALYLSDRSSSPGKAGMGLSRPYKGKDEKSQSRGKPRKAESDTLEDGAEDGTPDRDKPDENALGKAAPLNKMGPQ